jgi:hypothetical protein
MECTRCPYRLISKRLRPTISPRKQFSTSPTHHRLGAFNYAQEWQTGSYHFNKATTKTYPVAATRTDELLQNWFTQRPKKSHAQNSTSEAPSSSASTTAYLQQLRRNEITAERRKTDRVIVSHSTAKDYGERVDVTAFVWDGVEAAEMALEKRRLARRGAKGEGGKPGAKRRAPVRRRVAPGGMGQGAAGLRAGGPGRSGPGAGSGFTRKTFNFGKSSGGSAGVRRSPPAMSRVGNADASRGGARASGNA